MVAPLFFGLRSPHGHLGLEFNLLDTFVLLSIAASREAASL